VPKNRRHPLKSALLAAALLTLSSGTLAAGLGRLTVMSTIGEPLAAEIELSATPEELASLSARMASPEDFHKQGIEFQPALNSVRLSVERRADGRPYLRLYSDRPFNEPFLDVLIELNWAAGRVRREYTALLDPPAAMRHPPVAVAPTEAPQVTAPKIVVSPVESVASEAKPTSGEAASAKAIPPRAEIEGEKAGRMVQRGDTLAKIAREMQPEGVSLEQMLVALLRSNREAFVDGNMNRLRTGRILRQPQAEEVQAVDPAEARRIVVAQAADFNAYRQKLAGAVAGEEARPDLARREAAGRITPKVEEKLPPPAGKDKLEVSRTEQARDAEASKRIAALEEDLVAREKALREANERIALLEKNLSDLKKLVEMKSAPGAQIQAQAEAAKAAATPAEPPLKAADAIETPVATEPPAAGAAPAEAAKTPADEAKPAAEAAPGGVEPAAATPPAPAKPAAPAKPPAPVAPPPEPSFLEENLFLVVGGGGLIAGLLGFLGYRAWRRRKEMAAPAHSEMGAVMTADGAYPSTSGQSIDTGGPSIQTDFGPGAASGIDADEGVDPVAEADVYMAYGRDAQAEEILLEALKNEPTRQAIHMKLLEIYSARQSAKQFETVARDLHDLTGGRGDDWEKAAAMGRALEPTNPLYGGAAAAAAPPDLGATVVTTASLEETVVSPGELAKVAASAEFKASEPPVSAIPEEVSIEFDLDSPAAETATPAKAGEEVMSLDFDLDVGSPAAETPGQTKPAISLDFDLGLESPQSSAAGQEPVASQEAAASGGLDFELDLPPVGPETEAEPAATSAAAAAREEPAVTLPPLDLSSISLELEPPAKVPQPAAVEETLVLADTGEDSSEIATKLELAQAYEEMGDKEGARELLEEVLRDGNPNQQQLARARLAALDG